MIKVKEVQWLHSMRYDYLKTPYEESKVTHNIVLPIYLFVVIYEMFFSAYNNSPRYRVINFLLLVFSNLNH